MYSKLSEREEYLASLIVDIAFDIHKQLRPGLLESVYSKCFHYKLKAQENYHPVGEAQLISYLKLTNRRLGFLINFHVPLIKEGIKRIII